MCKRDLTTAGQAPLNKLPDLPYDPPSGSRRSRAADEADACRRCQAARRQGRHHVHTAYVGLGHDPPPARARDRGGGLSEDGTRWIACRPRFFLPVLLLSLLFRRLVIEMLLAAHYVGSFAAFLAPFRKSEWVVVGACWGDV